MMRRLSRRGFAGADSERGSAMVLSMAVILLTGLMATVLLASTVFTTSHTTATRASVQSVAAAEAGIDAVARHLLSGGACALPFSNPPSSPVHYSVNVFYQPSGGGAWVNGCPPANVDTLRLVSTGTAADSATGGNDRGDQAVVEMLLQRPNPMPAFNKALFGDVEMTLSTNLSVVGTTPTANDASLYTNKDFTCATAMTVNGNIYVGGNAVWSSSPCTAKGDVIVMGNMQCPSGTTIGGNLYVTGNLTLTGNAATPCRVNGSVWVGGSASNSTGEGTVVGGNFWVRGNMTYTGLPQIGGQVRFGGVLNASNYWKTQWLNRFPATIQNDATLGLPPSIPPSPDNTFPKVTPTSSLWNGWAVGNWSATRLASLGSPYDNNVCSPWSGTLTKPITVTTNTIFDTRSVCSGGLSLSSDLKIVLNADAVIFVTKYNQNGGTVQVVSGDGNEHSLYIVDPWPTSKTSCVPSPPSSIVMNSGTWSQPDGKTRVLLYTSNQIDVNMGSPALNLRGQLYGCEIVGSTSMTVQYAPVGAVTVPPGLAGLTLQHIRDITN